MGRRFEGTSVYVLQPRRKKIFLKITSSDFISELEIRDLKRIYNPCKLSI
jgi:hypothetical protein